ncbi:MAG: hypothetical protein ABR974_00385 [Bacteroidales bacterium]|jgi:hypothetical protein
MKKLFLLISFITIVSQLSFSQKDSISQPIVEIFTDFHVNLQKNDSKTTGFSINRAYFGYNYAFDKNFYTVLLLNIGSPDDLAAGSKPKRYAYFREASIDYSDDRISFFAGMISTELFAFQQRFLGMRYLANTFQDRNGYGFDADLGAEVKFKFSDTFQADLSLLNGEGSSSLQLDNNLKSSLGLTFTPSHNTALRLYGDIMKLNGVWQNTFLAFAGYKTDKYFLGGEFNFKTSLDTINGHNAWGISATGGFSITEKWMIFSRYDISRSVVPAGVDGDWNFKKDNSFLIAGIQYRISKMIKVAADYQGIFPDDPAKTISNMIYLNASLKF